MENQQTHTTFDLWITSHKKSYEKPQKPQTFSKSHTFVQDHDRHMLDQAGQNDSNSEGLYDGFGNNDLVLFIPYTPTSLGFSREIMMCTYELLRPEGVALWF